MADFGVYKWVRVEDVPQGVEIISTQMFHKLKEPGLVRSRIIGRQFANERNYEFHAGTPPLALLKYVLSRAASRGREWQLVEFDIGVAFLHAMLNDPLHAYPLPEIRREDWLWLVLRALYGTREASKAFQDSVRAMLDDHGCVELKAGSVLVVYHGDDFVAEESRAAWTRSSASSRVLSKPMCCREPVKVPDVRA